MTISKLDQDFIYSLLFNTTTTQKIWLLKQIFWHTRVRSSESVFSGGTVTGEM